MTGSIRTRLLLAASVVLAAFLGTAGWILETAFHDAAEEALREKLQSRVYALLAAADVDDQGRMLLPQQLPEPRLSQPDSGLYAFVVDADQRLFWRSESSLGLHLVDIAALSPGQSHFVHTSDLYVFSYGVDWEDDAGVSHRYTFVVAEQDLGLNRQMARFRTTLWSWLVGISVLLLLLQGGILGWSLRPLRKVATDLDRIRAGRTDRLQGRYPKELQGLTTSLNELLAHDRRQQNRYRTRLDDLAHSLKTPLAYLSVLLQDATDDCTHLRLAGREQLARMDHIVQHQLRRAAVSARVPLAAALPVAPLLQRIVKTLGKIYADKKMQVRMDLSANALFQGDEADFMEVVGNLLDNAFKYGHRCVDVSVDMRPSLQLVVRDDGPGIPLDLWESVLQRGSRLDESVAGQGIGLTVAYEIVTLYGGEMRYRDSASGGAVIRVIFP